MEDKGIISKKTILLIFSIIIIAIFSILTFLSPKENNQNASQNSIDDNTNTSEPQPLDESILYGKYVNEQDGKSYIEIGKDSYTYVMNNCERYFTYKSDEYVFTKKITSQNGIYNVTINLKSKDSKERLDLNFSITLKANDTNITIYGPGSCSGSRNFIKS